MIRYDTTRPLLELYEVACSAGCKLWGGVCYAVSTYQLPGTHILGTWYLVLVFWAACCPWSGGGYKSVRYTVKADSYCSRTQADLLPITQTARLQDAACRSMPTDHDTRRRQQWKKGAEEARSQFTVDLAGKPGPSLNSSY